VLSPSLLRTGLVVALGAHAVAHAVALVATVTTAGPAGGSRLPLSSWLQSGPTAPSIAYAATAVWLLATAAFIATTLAFLGVIVPHGAWRTLAVAGAILSLAGVGFLGMWPGSVSAGNSLLNLSCAIAMDTAILVTQLWLHWPHTPAVAA
jgi:hypothetical protein